MNSFFKLEPTIEVKVHNEEYDFHYLFKATVTGYDAVKEIDAFVKKYIPGHYLTTREILEKKTEVCADDEARG